MLSNSLSLHCLWRPRGAVSYTHLDVYKRQEVHPTRRGRVWEVVLTTVTKPGARIPAHIEVYALSERLLEHEDELRRLGISEDQAASCISLSTGLKDHHVLAAVQGTIIALAAELQAVAVRGPD